MRCSVPKPLTVVVVLTTQSDKIENPSNEGSKQTNHCTIENRQNRSVALSFNTLSQPIFEWKRGDEEDIYNGQSRRKATMVAEIKKILSNCLEWVSRVCLASRRSSRGPR